jgi:hypothetical protein
MPALALDIAGDHVSRAVRVALLLRGQVDAVAIR